MKRLISLFITALIPVLAFCLKEPIANTQLGLVLGTIQKSRRGDSYYSFRGLRYAESPAGDQRFKVSTTSLKIYSPALHVSRI